MLDHYCVIIVKVNSLMDFYFAHKVCLYSDVKTVLMSERHNLFIVLLSYSQIHISYIHVFIELNDDRVWLSIRANVISYHFPSRTLAVNFRLEA